jgi:general secretion pathway protein C
VACGTDLRVHAIVVGFEGDGRSYAAVTHAAGTAMLRPGMQLGGYEVGAIARERVTLVRGDERCELALFAPQIAAPPMPDPQPPIAQPAANPALEGGIEQISPTHFRVERRILEYLFEHQAEVMGLARVIPQREGDRVVAVRLYGIRRNSLLGRMGLQNGDAVRSINGYEASSPDQMLRALVDLRGASRVSVAIVRRGQPMTLDYDVAD